MGAWGAGSFDNDTACDWAEALKRVDNLSLIAGALGRVLDTDHDYLDSDVASKGLAACEVLARLKRQRRTVESIHRNRGSVGSESPNNDLF